MKTCFKCGESKELSKFYKHPRMADGRLGKCMECAKKDSARRIEVKKIDPAWVMSERDRSREKAHRYRHKQSKAATAAAKLKWANLNKIKVKAEHEAAKAAKRGLIKTKDHCEDCGVSGVTIQKHHPDYSKPLFVVFLCTKCHGIRHRKPAPQKAQTP